MPKTQIVTESITDLAVTEAKLGNLAVAEGKLANNAVTTGKINDGGVGAADLASSLDLTGKTVTLPASATAVVDQNIALLGFKMAVNDGLTVFNLVDGIVDEFHDESGTDEGEGSNDTYIADSDNYINSTSPTGSPIAVSAGFSLTAVTEADTSTAGTNPTYGSGTFGTFTVPTGLTSLNIQAWGAAGGSSMKPEGEAYPGGGGGYAEGTLAVTASQVFDVVVGEGGFATRFHDTSFKPPSVGGGGPLEGTNAPEPDGAHGAGGGLTGLFNVATAEISQPQMKGCCASNRGTYPSSGVTVVAGAGGGAGTAETGGKGQGGFAGGLIGYRGGGQHNDNTNSGGDPGPENSAGGGGSQTAGGQGGTIEDAETTSQTGGFLYGGMQGGPPSNDSNAYGGSGGSGYYGGGGGAGDPSYPNPAANSCKPGAGGGGSSYYGHPQITSGSTNVFPDSPGQQTINAEGQSQGATQPGYVSCTANAREVASIPQFPSSGGDNGGGGSQGGQDGYMLLTATVNASATSTTIVSNAFTASTAPSSSRIVVFQENVGTPTLNTDIIASISRDGGSNFTNVTLADSGYVTGSSGQRILTGVATVSGQPSGTSMRWKLALANNAVKIHGVSLQWK